MYGFIWMERKFIVGRMRGEEKLFSRYEKKWQVLIVLQWLSIMEIQNMQKQVFVHRSFYVKVKQLGLF